MLSRVLGDENSPDRTRLLIEPSAGFLMAVGTLGPEYEELSSLAGPLVRSAA
jgi:hypothetical protein